MRKKYAIDLGSSNTRLWSPVDGVLVNEPSVLAISAIDGSLVAIGSEAKSMLGKTPETLIPSFPINGGAVTDQDLSSTYVKNLLARVSPRFQPLGPDIMIVSSSGSTQVERRALLESVLRSGASHAYLVDTTLAASIGSGIPVSGASGHMVVNIGSDVTEAAILSLGGVVQSETKRVGSLLIDKAIASYLKDKYGLIIGLSTAEDIKKQIASATMMPKSQRMEVSGRDAVYGLPRLINVNSSELTEAIQDALSEIISPVTAVLENIPPELASDIIEKGIIMTGGGSLLTNFDKYLTDQTGVPSHVSEEPLLCCVRGAGVVLENIELWKRSILTK